ncbi:MAG: RNA methyltransferase, partial [Pseudomonadota bacterium]|nr:RNA methyltransferase [Pseudomonadota bacterium]
MKPAVILIGPQLGENIGTVARAMLNFGLEDLRLVNPRHGWDVDRAIKASAGADKVVENRKTFMTTAEAIADLGYIVATTARSRDMVKTVLTPEKTAKKIYTHAAEGVKSGLMFGPERTGLDNDDISLCDEICTVTLNPDFSSLNLAQAVLLMCYVWSNYKDDTEAEVLLMTDTRPANRGELLGMFAHLENALDEAGFLAPPEKKPA